MSLINGFPNPFFNSNHFNAYAALSKEKIKRVFHFHSSLPVYKETPLNTLHALANYIGVQNIFVKDESKRFGLNAFKGLGASYAVANYYANLLNIELGEVTFDELLTSVKKLPPVTFTTTTDGNHGKSLAWTAKLFGQTAKIFMPKGSAPARLDAILSLGAEAYETELNYDDTVQYVRKLAKQNDWVLIQDTAWEGYEDIPLTIMQGYATIIMETVKQLPKQKLNQISHIFLQAGVGSFPAAIAATISSLSEGTFPKIIIVEPDQANCFYMSALDQSGKPKRVLGDLNTMMAGLACGVPSPIAWEILKNSASYFISCHDKIAAKGMRILGNPLGNDPRMISGESGAVPLGVVFEVMTNPEYQVIRQEINLDKDANILLISTEGDTDPINYRKIVWE